MTSEEKIFISETVDLWNLFLSLEDMTKDDIDDVRRAIHAIQHIVMKNEAKRNNPDIFI